jgi:acyl carrier protein
MSDTFNRVRTLIADKLNVEESKVVETANFIDDLGADSLSMVELVMELEETFGVEISEEEVTKLTTVQAAVDYIEQNAA